MKHCLLLVVLCCGLWADTHSVTCTGTITTTLQAAVDAAVDDDVVSISAGTCDAGTISWSNKNITVMGQGVLNTTVTGLNFHVTTTTKAAFRITGIDVGAAAAAWNVDGYNRTTGIKGWRIDNIKFTYPSCAQNISIYVRGLTWGLMDHLTFSNAGNAVYIQSWAEATDEVDPWPPTGTPGMGGYSWLLPLNLGSDEAVYVEDCTFNMDSGCLMGANDMYFGGRMVFRHNSVLNCYWQNHAARGYNRGGNLKAEIYNNDFNATYSGWSRAIHMRSGTGVVFNNSLRGYFVSMMVDNQRSNGQNVSLPFGPCDGTSAWDGNTPDEEGWPCLDQIGRSSGTSYPNQTSEPLYIWNNGSSLGCSTGGSCANDITMGDDADPHVLAGRDYINNGTTPKPGYTAYTYPHPLQNWQYGGSKSQGSSKKQGRVKVQ